MKIISILLSILISTSTLYTMELIPASPVNLDTLAKETLTEISYFLDARNIATIRCINRPCKKNALSSEELDKCFALAVLRAISEDNTSELPRWRRYIACLERAFLNFLTTDKKDVARFVYAEYHLDPNTILDTAAKYGDIQGAQLSINDYYATDANRALKTAVAYQFKDLATTLIKNHRANLPYIRKKAVEDGNICLFNQLNKFYPPEAFSLHEELKLAVKNGHIELVKTIIDNEYALKSHALLSEAASGCLHCEAENCGHKDIIRLFLNEHKMPNIHEALILAAQSGRKGMVIWLITQYKSLYLTKHIRAAISEAKRNGHEELESLLEKQLYQ